MTTRSPNNPRSQAQFQRDAEMHGQSRKSAASAKPVTKAGSTVTVKAKPTTKREKRKAEAAREKKERGQVQQRLAQAGDPTDPTYKFWRKWWWVTIIAAIVFTLLSWVSRDWFDGSLVMSYTMLGLAYAFIIIALILDWKKIRPIRKAWQAQATKPLSKSKQKAYDKQEAQIAAAAQAEKEAKAASRGAKVKNFWRPKPKTTQIDSEIAAAEAEASGNEPKTASAQKETAKSEPAKSAKEDDTKPASNEK